MTHCTERDSRKSSRWPNRYSPTGSIPQTTPKTVTPDKTPDLYRKVDLGNTLGVNPDIRLDIGLRLARL